MENRVHQVYRVEGFPWHESGMSEMNRLVDEMTRSHFWGRAEYKYGFVNVCKFDRAIGGMFTQQYHWRQHKYEDVETRIIVEEQPFEDRYFLLHVPSGHLVFDDRPFIQKGGLSLGETRERFVRCLADVLEVEQIELVEESASLSNEEMFARFSSSKVVEVELSRLRHIQARNFSFFNPNHHLNKIGAKLLDDKFLPFVDDATFKSRESPSLELSSVVRLLAKEGSLDKMTIRSNNDSVGVSTISKQDPIRIQIEVPVGELVDEQLRQFLGSQILSQVAMLVRGTLRDADVDRRVGHKRDGHSPSIQQSRLNFGGD